MNLTKEDMKLLYLAVSAFANWRETGDMSLSRNDVLAQSRKDLFKNLKTLDVDQQKQILRLRELAEAFLNKQIQF